VRRAPWPGSSSADAAPHPAPPSTAGIHNWPSDGGRAGNMRTLVDALEATLIADACERSRREHRPVAMEELRR